MSYIAKKVNEILDDIVKADTVEALGICIDKADKLNNKLDRHTQKAVNYHYEFDRHRRDTRWSIRRRLVESFEAKLNVLLDAHENKLRERNAMYAKSKEFDRKVEATKVVIIGAREKAGSKIVQIRKAVEKAKKKKIRKFSKLWGPHMHEISNWPELADKEEYVFMSPMGKILKMESNNLFKIQFEDHSSDFTEKMKDGYFKNQDASVPYRYSGNPHHITLFSLKAIKHYLEIKNTLPPHTLTDNINTDNCKDYRKWSVKRNNSWRSGQKYNGKVYLSKKEVDE